MPPVPCSRCSLRPSSLVRPKTGDKVCKQCFSSLFEEEVHQTIVSSSLFSPGMRVAIGASGGKDSTVLARVLSKLNRERGYGVDLFLLSVDEGISGYRDDSLESVKRNHEEYGLPLRIVSYAEIYGWTMDQIVAQIGQKNNCSYCGVFRRQALDRGAELVGAHLIATGHNCDDIAETVLMNILRGDISRLDRCVAIVTGEGSELPRCKPFKYCYEKEIVLYAYYNSLDYFSTECVYAPFAYRGFAREYLKELEKSDPRSIINIVQAGESMRVREERKEKMNKMTKCSVCGFVSSNEVCKACVLLEGLNKGREARTAMKMREKKEEEKEEQGQGNEKAAGGGRGTKDKSKGAANTKQISVSLEPCSLSSLSSLSLSSASETKENNSNASLAPVAPHPFRQHQSSTLSAPSSLPSSAPLSSPASPSSSPPSSRAAAPVAVKQSMNVTDW